MNLCKKKSQKHRHLIYMKNILKCLNIRGYVESAPQKMSYPMTSPALIDPSIIMRNKQTICGERQATFSSRLIISAWG